MSGIGVRFAGVARLDAVRLRRGRGDGLCSRRRRFGGRGLGRLTGARLALGARAFGGRRTGRLGTLLVRRRRHLKARLPEGLLGLGETLASDFQLALGDQVDPVVRLGPAARFLQFLAGGALLRAPAPARGPARRAARRSRSATWPCPCARAARRRGPPPPAGARARGPPARPRGRRAWAAPSPARACAAR